MPVGSGKTATGILTAMHAFALDPEARVLLTLPAATTKQLLERDIPWARSHLVGWVPRWISFYKQPFPVRSALAKRRQPGVYILPYSLFSEEDARHLLELIDADLVIADEAQHLRGTRKSARAVRFWQWIEGFQKRREDPPLGVAMSGTMQTSTPADYHRLIRWTLRESSPLPRPVVEAQAWSKILRSRSEEEADVGADGCRRVNPYLSPEDHERMLHLLSWARKNFPQEALTGDDSTTIRAARTAYKLRFRCAPGVVPMGENDLGVALRIENLSVPEPSRVLSDMIDEVDRSWTGPDGTVLSYAIQKVQVLSQLTAGFYLRHYWPEPSERFPLERLRASQKAFRASQFYAPELRRFLASRDSSKLRLDTPRQVGKHHAVKGEIDGWPILYELWSKWRELDEELEPSEKPTKARLTSLELVDPYKINCALAWAKRKKHGIIWVEHRLFGDAVFRALATEGLYPLRKEEGDEWLPGDGSKGRIVVAGRKAHGEGKNLQHDHRNQLFLQWCRPQHSMEQLLGRVHRLGQKADEVVVHTVRVTEFDHQVVSATLWDTVYDQQTMGGAKKLLIADWDPLPPEYPPDFLRERGLLRNSTDEE